MVAYEWEWQYDQQEPKRETEVKEKSLELHDQESYVSDLGVKRCRGASILQASVTYVSGVKAQGQATRKAGGQYMNKEY